MSGYNGHKNWAHWNVSLWLHNDEGLYHEMRRCIRKARTKDEAARMMLGSLHEMGIRETPDGATYSVTTIRAAMRD